jgi:hypothetical protein
MDGENKRHFSYVVQELAEMHSVISANEKHKGQAGPQLCFCFNNLTKGPHKNSLFIVCDDSNLM